MQPSQRSRKSVRTVLTTTVPVETASRLAAAARRDDRSISATIRRIVNDWATREADNGRA